MQIGSFKNPVSRKKRAAMLNVSEVKKTKAGKVTIGYQLVLAGLATEGRCSASSQEGDHEVGVASRRLARHPRGVFHFVLYSV